MIPRIDLIEVNPPCPILIQNNSTIRVRKDKYDPKSRVFTKWESIKSLITYNPDNELGERYRVNLLNNEDKDAEGFFIGEIIPED